MSIAYDAYEDWTANRIVLKIAMPESNAHGASLHFDMQAEQARTLGLALLNAVAKYDDLNAGLVQPAERKIKKGDLVQWNREDGLSLQGTALENEWENGYVRVTVPGIAPEVLVHKERLILLPPGDADKEKVTFKAGDRVKLKKGHGSNSYGTVCNKEGVNLKLFSHMCGKEIVAVIWHDRLYEKGTASGVPAEDLILVPPPTFNVGDEVSFWSIPEQQTLKGPILRIDDKEATVRTVDTPMTTIDIKTTPIVPLSQLVLIEKATIFKEGDRVYLLNERKKGVVRKLLPPQGLENYIAVDISNSGHSITVVYTSIDNIKLVS